MISFFKGANQVFAVATKETISQENCEETTMVVRRCRANQLLRQLTVLL